MEFVKIYKTQVPNSARTLDRKVKIAPLLDKAKSSAVRSSLSSLLKHEQLNFWDFGVRATPQISIGSPVKIVCGTTCYSGVVIYKLNDSTGELGDLLGWARQFKAPWKNVCALDIQSSLPITTQEIKQLVSNSPETAPSFFKRTAPSRKPEALIEGSIVELNLTAFERDPEARKACLAHYGTSCQICQFDFGAAYGDLGNGFIHVHHIVPLSQIRGAHIVDPIKDLIPVCPNCHAMLHINQGAALPIEQLKKIVAHRKG